MSMRGVVVGSSVVAIAALIIACSSTEEAPAAPHDAGPVLPIEPADPGPIDSGFDAALPPSTDAGNAFDFAPAFTLQLGPTSRNAAHNFPANTPPTNPANSVCVDCHKAADGGAPDAGAAFFAGGTVKWDADGGPAAQIEVGLKTKTGEGTVIAHTDDDGNWFITSAQAESAKLQFAVRAGVRDATKKRLMGSSPAIGRCNNCHNIHANTL